MSCSYCDEPPPEPWNRQIGFRVNNKWVSLEDIAQFDDEIESLKRQIIDINTIVTNQQKTINRLKKKLNMPITSLDKERANDAF